MLWTILVVLLLLWLVGFYGGFVTHSLIHAIKFHPFHHF